MEYIVSMTAFLKDQPMLIDECDEQVIKKFSGKIMVCEDRNMEEFKSEVEGEVEM